MSYEQNGQEEAVAEDEFGVKWSKVRSPTCRPNAFMKGDRKALQQILSVTPDLTSKSQMFAVSGKTWVCLVGYLKAVWPELFGSVFG